MPTARKSSWIGRLLSFLASGNQRRERPRGLPRQPTGLIASGTGIERDGCRNSRSGCPTQQSGLVQDPASVHLVNHFHAIWVVESGDHTDDTLGWLTYLTTPVCSQLPLLARLASCGRAFCCTPTDSATIERNRYVLPEAAIPPMMPLAGRPFPRYSSYRSAGMNSPGPLNRAGLFAARLTASLAPDTGA